MGVPDGIDTPMKLAGIAPPERPYRVTEGVPG
jgi:hypothetical protein